MRSISVAICLMLAVFTGYAMAQPLRKVPDTAVRAKMTSYYDGSVKLGSKVYLLAPGALIFNTENRILLPVYVPETTEVAYLLNSDGRVWRVWILAPEEVQ
ncbi:MAG: hypothetical protein JNJ60_14445 [Rhodocyclaceae bacterium]|nr:hypothetical protein [Rhodocyclaceae bacterium]